RALRWKLANGQLTGKWVLPLGLNDSLASRPGKKPVLVRRDLGRPRPVIRARELGGNAQVNELYTLSNLAVEGLILSADGRVLLVNVHDGKRRLAQLYNGLTGEKI